MADADWKKRLGININYSSGEEDEDSHVEYRVKSTSPELPSFPDESSTEDILSRFEEYGNTPPRTRLKIKNRDWDRKQKMEDAAKTRNTRMARSRVNRRNTMDCALLNQMFIDDENKRLSEKRAAQIQREMERDSKIPSNIMINSQRTCLQNPPLEERADSLPIGSRQSQLLTSNRVSIPTLIESCNRFMSLTSRPIGSRMSAPPSAFAQNQILTDPTNETVLLQTRKTFHDTFANLIKLGSCDKQDKNCRRTMSHEEYMWQTELKDLIWLELQAWHADRTLEQQDKYLCSARQNVGDLLLEITNYKFHPKLSRGASIISDSDSGISSDNGFNDNNFNKQVNTSPCFGCISMYCRDCLDQQSLALKQVEVLLNRLETAEALYPSSQAMGNFHPLYKSEHFVGRVKAMCLWYNMTRHHRLKLLILGKLLARLQGKEFQWPVTAESGDSTTSTNETRESSMSKESTDSKFILSPIPQRISKVQFNLDDTTESASPSDSTSSTESSKEPTTPDIHHVETASDFGKLVNDVNIYNVESLANVTYSNVSHSTSPYRKYIENVLKSRGLGKSLSFLHRLHNVVLRKAHIALEKPGTEDTESESDFLEEDMPVIEIPLDKEQEEELRKYGAWSAEAQSLNLPSYVPAFIFLSLIPLEVIHEFLRMRLETRPLKPNPLSLEQLMKELREGLTLAMIHRERFNKHINTALAEKDNELERYINILDEFDNTVKKVLELYLDYVEQWVLVAAPETHQKSALDEEWMFTKLVCPMIPGQHSIAAQKFCLIVRKLITDIGARLISRVSELDDKIVETSVQCDTTKWQLLTVCREIQALFTVEREKSVKVMSFAKSLCRDIEHSDFHRDHSEEFLKADCVCPAVSNSVTLLKKDSIIVPEKITAIINRIQERCDIKNMIELDENDRLSVLSRAREILHQGYKFGFEYYKDLSRLFETKMSSCKNSKCELNLSLGIISFAKMWMKFVMERCERGRGLRPRWAAQGFDFLSSSCDPNNTKHLSDLEFEELKSLMDACISHVIGSVSEPERVRASPRSRRSSPAPSRARTPTRSPLTTATISNQTKSLFPQLSYREETVGLSPNSTPDTPDLVQKQTSYDTSVGISLIVPKLNNYTPVLRQVRIRDSINRLDMELENKLREKNLIGQVKALNSCDKIHIRARSVTFRWHRGIKIGQGRFGKVYTAVNNSTGDLMAMKEIAIQPGENRAVKRVAEELKILEGINHKHLVRYYGVEIHREELLIFMELCAEGTLESLVELSGGLFEGLTRRFTAQLLSGVAELHKHGVVHRDIKTANIFLTDKSNCLKLGDFGSAVKIQSHTTMAGELQGYVGTQAYMAPEVFTKTNSEGHGRAADIWSVGCVIVEMASGKRPWAQFDSNFQIMFKVGMGETPEAPNSLSQEGHEFLENCLQHDPKDRLPASELLLHNFCKVGLEDSCNCDDHKEKEIRRSIRRHSKP